MSTNKKSSNKTTYINRNAGVTLVELIICFALLAVFLAAASMCISHAIIFFYNEKQEMAAFSVGDIVFSEIKDDIRTMQGSDYNGYVKLRMHDDGTGTLKSSSVVAGHAITGSSIEFVTSNVQDAPVAVQIDAEGCGGGTGAGGLFSNAVLIDADGLRNSNIQNITPEHLTLRYYYKYPETDLDEYRNLYMDKVVPNSTAAKEAGFSSLVGAKVVWHALEKLSASSYQDFTVNLTFSVDPKTVTVDPGDGSSEDRLLVEYVDVTVDVVDRSGEVSYTKMRRVELLNTVYYYNEPTLYSDLD